MFAGIGFGAERIGLAALRFRKIAAIGLFALLICIGLSLPRVSFDDDIHRVFLSDSALSMAQRAYEQEQSPPLSTVLVHISTATAFSVDELTVLRDLSLDLEFIDGVKAVASPFMLRWPPDQNSPSGIPVFKQIIEQDYASILDNFESLSTGLPTFLNAPRSAMLLAVSVDTSRTTVTDAASEMLSQIESRLPVNLSAKLTGEDLISAEIVAGLKADLIALNIWGALIVTFAAIALLRDIRMTLLATVPALFGATGVLALSVWLGYPITVLSNVIPILLLVLGVADGVHLAGHIKDNGSVRGAIQQIGPACALTALTTAAAFASITLTGNAQLFEFAVLGALGTLLSFVIVIVAFSLIGSAMPLSSKPTSTFGILIAKPLTRAGAKTPRAIIAACLLLLVASFWGFGQTKAWFPLYQNLPAKSATLTTNDAIADDFGGVFQMIVESDRDWEQIHALVSQLETITSPQAVLSEVSFARWLGDSNSRPNQEQLAMLPPALVSHLKTEQGPSRIFISIPEPMRNAASLATFDRLHETAMDYGASHVIGLPTVMRYEAVTLIQHLSFALVAAALGATLLVALAFRSIRFLPILLVPNVLPLMLTGASLHIWAQGELTPTAVLALTIAFGIAIDDTVHFMSRYMRAKTEGYDCRESLDCATSTSGQIMVITTLLLTAGLCVTLFSDFHTIRLFGGMMMITLWAALLVDLLLLPALLVWQEAGHHET